MARFDICLAFTLRPENDGQHLHTTSGDRGGATSWGVTLSTYAAWRAARGYTSTSVSDLEAATKAELAELYRVNYWNVVSGDRLTAGIDLLAFDFGVTAGPGRSIRLLQDVLGVAVDGNLGPRSVAAAMARDRATLVRQLHARHAEYYQSLDDFPKFGRGWLRRNDDRLTAALASVVSPAPAPAANENTPPRPGFLDAAAQEVRHVFSA